MSINKVILIGRIGKNPEIRKLENGEVATFSLATSESWKDKATGEKKEKVEWHNIVVWGGLVNIVKLASRGSKIYVEGKLCNRKYESNGTTKYITEVVLQGYGAKLELLDSQKPKTEVEEKKEQPSHPDEVESDEIPF